MKIVCTILILLISDAYGFSGRKCDAFMKREGFFGLPTFLTTSTGQFLSSSGECSAIGMNKEDQRKNFYYVNINHLRREVAKGSGENLESFFYLAGCDSSSTLSLKKKLKKNYKSIFSKDVIDSYLYITPIVEKYCKDIIEKT